LELCKDYKFKKVVINTHYYHEQIEDAVDIIAKYTIGYYGDSTSFSPNDIKTEFYEFIK
jgi:NDP-sugar pyrophosphorylase family protein